MVQAILLIILSAIMKKGKRNYLFSFVTAVFYGLVLDLATAIIGLLPCEGLAGRLAWFVGELYWIGYFNGRMLSLCGNGLLDLRSHPIYSA